MSDLAATPPALCETNPLDAACGVLGHRLRPNRRVLLVQVLQILLPSFNREVALNQGYYIFPPTGLQCLVAAAQAQWPELEFRILDLNYEVLKRVHEDPAFAPDRWPDILAETLKSYDPGVVGVSCMFDLGIDSLLGVLRHLRQEGRRIVLTGGVIATYEYRSLLDQDLCHFVVRGEGENKFNLLLERLTRRTTTLPPLAGIHFLHEGVVRESPGEVDRVAGVGNLVSSYAQVPIEHYHRYGSLN
ncbi:MAG: cobalamin-dependent protein, partial [Magnetococcales bacterium]|nr:cobalamin-dependent protein [Magnetococcales bacterium]